MWKSYVAFGIYLVCCVLLGLLISMITPNECISEKCLKKTRLILNDMATSVKPCTNFYKFVCGNYVGLYGTKDKPDQGSVWEDIKERQLRSLALFLNQPVSKHDDRILRVLKMVYKSCLNTKDLDKEGVQPLLNNIRSAGGFPLVEGDTWNEKGDWFIGKAEYKIRYTGFLGGNIFSSYIEHVEHENQFYVHLTPPETLEFEDSHFDDYYTYVKKVGSLLGMMSSAINDKEINDTLTFKSQLLKLERKVENCSSPLNHEDLKQFSQEFPFLELDAFLKDMLPYISVPSRLLVTYVSRRYFSGVKTLIQNTPNRTIANFLMIENIIEVTPMLPAGFRDALTNLRKKTNPFFNIERNRKVVCVICIKSKISSALSSLYLRNIFKQYVRPSYLEMTVISLKQQIRNMVNRLSWMDEQTKQRALEKLEVMDYAAPVPEDVFKELTDKVSFRVYYEDLCFIGDTTDSLTAFLALQRYKTDKNWELLERRPTVFDNEVDIFSAEVVFDRQRNLVVVPLGFLKYPTYDGRWPKYFTYGGFCSKVAMELIRGIDFSGARYGSDGRLRDWWSVETKADYKAQTGCFINQFNNYAQHRSIVTLKDPKCVEDHVARLAGVKVAYLAYVKYEKERFFGERKLPGLKDYSDKQLFFIDFATFYCARKKSFYHEGMTELEASKGSKEYKVIGTLWNLKYFSRQFGCSLNETMNPSEKCPIWDRK